MGSSDVTGCRHVACSTGRSSVIFAGRPVSVVRIPGPLITFCVVNGAVFGFVVNFDLRVIRPQMALVACFGFTSFDQRKAVAGMAAAAAAEAAVGVDAAHTDIGPGAGKRFTPVDLHDGAVAGKAAGGSFYGIVHAVVEPMIDLPNDLVGIGMFAAFVFFRLLWVTAAAIYGRNHYRNRTFVVFEVRL